MTTLLPTQLPTQTKPPTRAMQAEIQLLLWCSRTHPEAFAVAQIKAMVREEIDWPVLIAIARAHGVMPLVYQTLSTICPSALPQAVLAKFRYLFHTNALRNRFLGQELIKLLEFLSANDIGAIPFKGPTLAALAYGDLGLRQFSDLDILVDQKDFLTARSLLLAHGYQRKIKHIFLAEEQAQDLEILRNLGEYPLQRNDGLVSVDLHQRLVTGREFILSGDFSDFWQRLESIELCDTSVSTFQPEALLVYLCIHGTKEFWRRLIWICDVAELIQSHPNLDWCSVMRLAQKLRVEQMLWMGLSLAQDLLGTRLPKNVERLIQLEFKQRSLAKTLQKRIRGDVNGFEKTMAAPERFLFSLKMTESRRDKVRTVLRMLAYWIPPTIEDQKFWQLPDKLRFLYYLIRPVRLIGKYGLSQFRRLA